MQKTLQVFVAGYGSPGKSSLINGLSGSFIADHSKELGPQFCETTTPFPMEIYKFNHFDYGEDDCEKTQEKLEIMKSKFHTCDVILWVFWKASNINPNDSCHPFFKVVMRVNEYNNKSTHQIKMGIVTTGNKQGVEQRKTFYYVHADNKLVMQIPAFRVSTEKMFFANMMKNDNESIPTKNKSVNYLQEIFSTAGVPITKAQQESILTDQKILKKELVFQESLFPDLIQPEIRGDWDGLIPFLKSIQAHVHSSDETFVATYIPLLSTAKNVIEVKKYMTELIGTLASLPQYKEKQELYSFLLSRVFSLLLESKTRSFEHILYAWYISILDHVNNESNEVQKFFHQEVNRLIGKNLDKTFPQHDQKSCVAIVYNLIGWIPQIDNLVLHMLKYAVTWDSSWMINLGKDCYFTNNPEVECKPGYRQRSVFVSHFIIISEINNDLRICILLALCNKSELETIVCTKLVPQTAIVNIFGTRGLARFSRMISYYSESPIPILFCDKDGPDLSENVKQIVEVMNGNA